jgi:hypothetical protein
MLRRLWEFSTAHSSGTKKPHRRIRLTRHSLCLATRFQIPEKFIRSFLCLGLLRVLGSSRTGRCR